MLEKHLKTSGLETCEPRRIRCATASLRICSIAAPIIAACKSCWSQEPGHHADLHPSQYGPLEGGLRKSASAGETLVVVRRELYNLRMVRLFLNTLSFFAIEVVLAENWPQPRGHSEPASAANVTSRSSGVKVAVCTGKCIAARIVNAGGVGRRGVHHRAVRRRVATAAVEPEDGQDLVDANGRNARMP